MHQFDFKMTTEDQNIGTVYLPYIDSKSLPVIIYCHGWGGNRQVGPPLDFILDRAMKENIALVTFDFFGCGDTGGEYGLMTYARWKQNLKSIYSWVKQQPFACKNKIGCYAVSSGSTAALRFAAENDKIAFVISVGTCISTHIGMKVGGPQKLMMDNLDPLLSGGKVNLFDVPFGVDFFIDTISNAPIHTMDRIGCPVLFLQGTSDNAYRCADAKMGYDLMKSKNLNAEHIEFPGGLHGLENKAEESEKSIFEWLIPLLNVKH